MKAKGKVFATTISDSDGSNSNSEESCDGEGNYSAFLTIAPVDSSEDLTLLVEELGEHTKVECMGIGEESDDEDEGTKELQESYNSLLKKTREYARVAKASEIIILFPSFLSYSIIITLFYSLDFKRTLSIQILPCCCYI